MTRSTLPMTLFIFALASILAACGVGAQPAPPEEDPNQIATSVAQTVVAQLTQTAAASTPTLMPEPTQTPVPPTATSEPTATASPTALPVTPSATPIPCDWAEFEGDIAVKDGATFEPGTDFTKVWRLKNIGSCTWTSDYDLVFVSGERLGGVTPISLSGNVRPGQSVDLSVDLTAPEKRGTYQGFWMLRNEDGLLFGIGPGANSAFWVRIETVQFRRTNAYKFAPNYCSAEWRSGAGPLPCPGTETDAEGFVIKVDEPNIEGRRENETGLWTHPEQVEDGWIVGRYPGIDVRVGDRFRAIIGCLDAQTECDVDFQLDYETRSGVVKTLGRWNEEFDGRLRSLDVDLSDLAGENIIFILTVEANGSNEGDWAFWLEPRISRLQNIR